MARNDSQGPGVWVPPPLIFAAGLLLGWFIDARLIPARLADGRGALPLALVGATVALVGVALCAWGMITFARARTAIVPVQRASQLVVNGPYRFTRNPMYTGLTILYVGLVALMNTIWPLVMLPVVLYVVRRFVVGREEAYLHREFGPAYDEYRRRVRRWL